MSCVKDWSILCKRYISDLHPHTGCLHFIDMRLLQEYWPKHSKGGRWFKVAVPCLWMELPFEISGRAFLYLFKKPFEKLSLFLNARTTH